MTSFLAVHSVLDECPYFLQEEIQAEMIMLTCVKLVFILNLWTHNQTNSYFMRTLHFSISRSNFWSLRGKKNFTSSGRLTEKGVEASFGGRAVIAAASVDTFCRRGRARWTLEMWPKPNMWHNKHSTTRVKGRSCK